MIGAVTGAMPLTDPMVPIAFMSSRPSKRSVAIERDSTMPLAPAKPWKNRRVIKVRILGDRIEITVMAMKSTRQTRSGFLRPR